MVVDGTEKEPNERCTGGSWYEIMESIKPLSPSTSEIVAFHKVKRLFLNLADIDKEDPNQLMMCNLRVRISNY